MPKLRSFPILLSALLLLGGCVRPFATPSNSSEPLHLTGFLEARQTHIAAEMGGRILSITVAEGDAVQAGEILVQLDDSFQQKQLAVADARVQEAKAELAQLQASVRPEDIALAEAQVVQAEIALKTAEEALADAILLRDNPQELDIQIAQARAALSEAQAHARAAKYQAAAADIEAQMWEAITRDLWDGVQVTIPGRGTTVVDAPPDKIDYASTQWNLASQAAWIAWQNAAQADSAVTKAQAQLNDLLAIKKNPQNAEKQVTAATNARDEAAATLIQARAQLDAIKAGPTQTQLEAAAAAVRQAQAERDVLAVQLENATLTAPISGWVSARYYQPGEVVA
ncbi:MAG: biotin/lipoyl-binding protein, partial [Chloroflexi bacterium]|nr:biotin/lipoyl-binding protein [Chloroflexota bacterium]